MDTEEILGQELEVFRPRVEKRETFRKEVESCLTQAELYAKDRTRILSKAAEAAFPRCADLVEMISELYFFPQARRMPLDLAMEDLFLEEEVGAEIQFLKMGKAKHSKGFSTELVKWGVHV
ncbi:hypothetical protein R1flu_008301 [Riccia fluitans]|uniref:Uncharacterized protein n=1 Tax=Riccia fluitans TaxID=41844 RepID=A0ABD1YBC4_9MARC